MRIKKNLTILGIALVNLILSSVAIINMSSGVPINFFASALADKMVPKAFLFILPAVICIISLLQVLYRIKTMDVAVTTGKIVEDAVFTFVDGILILANWVLLYIGILYTKTLVVNIELPLVYIAIIVLAILMAAIYSTFPINNQGSFLGLRIKETLEDKQVWRIANRFNGFTGFISSIIIILLCVYFIIYGFNWVYAFIGLVACVFLMGIIPVMYAKMVSRKIAERIVE